MEKDKNKKICNRKTKRTTIENNNQNIKVEYYEDTNNKNKNNIKLIFNSNPKHISFKKDLYIDMSKYFLIFKSINNIIYLIKSYNNNSILLYSLIKFSLTSEIKNAHKDQIIEFSYFLDEIQKRDLVISLSTDNNIKLWNLNK